tara:strand:- start:136 stop:519 length:384 start_codon:yes stop_codon:yes gene_type:complete
MEHIEKSIKYSSREKVRKSVSSLQLTEPITDFQWGTFVSLQLLDIYTTYKGLQYDCVYETNPLFGERPSVMKMGVTKFVILYPAMVAEQKNQTLSRENLTEINFLMSLVILNNADVANRAQNNCIKL